MWSRRSISVFLRLALCLLLAGATVVTAAPDALAHAEMLQSSPRSGSTVGGEFHSIQLQFTGLDLGANQRFDLLDPAGKPVDTEPVTDQQRVILPIEPLTVPGVYTISFTVIGQDGDLSSDTATFLYEPTADEPEALTISLAGETGFDYFGFGLLLAGAGALGYLAHRFRLAWRDHKLSQANPAPADTD